MPFAIVRKCLDLYNIILPLPILPLLDMFLTIATAKIVGHKLLLVFLKGIFH